MPFKSVKGGGKGLNMNDKLFEEYISIRAKLEWLIEQTSKNEVLGLLDEDFDISGLDW